MAAESSKANDAAQQKKHNHHAAALAVTRQAPIVLSWTKKGPTSERCEAVTCHRCESFICPCHDAMYLLLIL